MITYRLAATVDLVHTSVTVHKVNKAKCTISISRCFLLLKGMLFIIIIIIIVNNDYDNNDNNNNKLINKFENELT